MPRSITLTAEQLFDLLQVYRAAVKKSTGSFSSCVRIKGTPDGLRSCASRYGLSTWCEIKNIDVPRDFYFSIEAKDARPLFATLKKACDSIVLLTVPTDYVLPDAPSTVVVMGTSIEIPIPQRQRAVLSDYSDLMSNEVFNVNDVRKCTLGFDGIHIPLPALGCISSMFTAVFQDKVGRKMLDKYAGVVAKFAGPTEAIWFTRAFNSGAATANVTTRLSAVVWPCSA